MKRSLHCLGLFLVTLVVLFDYRSPLGGRRRPVGSSCVAGTRIR